MEELDYRYCYILDFTACLLVCIHLDEHSKKWSDFEDDEDLLRYWGFNPDQCHWLFTDEELELTHVYQPLK